MEILSERQDNDSNLTSGHPPVVWSDHRQFRNPTNLSRGTQITSQSSGGFTAAAQAALRHLPPGNYTLQWTLNGFLSNIALLEIVPRSQVPPVATLERSLDEHGRPTSEMLVHYRNSGAKEIDILETLGARVFADNKEVEHRAIRGMIGHIFGRLAPGQSWVETIDLREYYAGDNPVIKGAAIFVKIGGTRTNTIRY